MYSRGSEFKNFITELRQLANEDDLQSKSVIKEIVLGIDFYMRIDYRRNDFKQIVLFLEIHSPQCTVFVARQ